MSNGKTMIYRSSDTEMTFGGKVIAPIDFLESIKPPYWLIPGEITLKTGDVVGIYLKEGVDDLEALYKQSQKDRNEYRARILEMHAEHSVRARFNDDDWMGWAESHGYDHPYDRAAALLEHYAKRIREGAM